MGDVGQDFSSRDMFRTLREDIREVHRDLSQRNDALMERVLEQNSRIGKGEERHLAILHRIEVLEGASQARAQTSPELPARDAEEKPVTRRDATIAYLTVGAFAGGLVFLWQVVSQVLRLVRP